MASSPGSSQAGDDPCGPPGQHPQTTPRTHSSSSTLTGECNGSFSSPPGERDTNAPALPPVHLCNDLEKEKKKSGKNPL